MGAGLESGRPSVTRGGLKIGEIPNVQDTARQGVEAALNTPKMPLSQARVLLAEDENYLVDMLIDTLSFLGVDTQNNVQVVTSGLEMQAKIKE